MKMWNPEFRTQTLGPLTLSCHQQILPSITMFSVSHRSLVNLIMNFAQRVNADNLRMMGIKVRFSQINIEIMLRKMNFLFVIEKWVSIVMLFASEFTQI